jgi:hypothetical protein
MKEFISIILDGIEPIMFWVYYFFAFLGVVTYLVIDLWNRNEESERTPLAFDWNFWIKDNWLRVVLTLVLAPIVIILFQEITEAGITIWGAFTVGLSTDVIIAQLQKLRNRWKSVKK